jgi:uncharacterized repeat protein (TIGR03809 family)
MTHRFDVGARPDLAARWCTLAEQRLDYLTELFKNGRWRRYYTHAAFLENIKEAKAMVAHWRTLSTGEPTEDDKTVISLLEVTQAAIVVEPALREIERVAASGIALPDQVAPAPAAEVKKNEAQNKMSPGVDLLTDRYPSLRNLAL